MFKPSRSLFPVARAAALALALLVAPSLYAQTNYWWDSNDSAAGFGNAQGTWAAPTTNNATQGWTIDNTGSTTMSGSTTTANDNINFGTSTNQLGTGTITVSGNVSARRIDFTGSSSNITLSGGNITLGTSSIITVTNSANTSAITETISSNITLGASPTWTVNNGGTVGTATLNVSGNVIGGSYGLTKGGNGTLTLSGAANTWNGTTTVSAGTLTLSGSLTTNGSVSVSSNSTLNITGNLTKLTAGTFQLGQTANQTDTINVSGSGILNGGAGITLGNNAVGRGILNITGGAVNTGGLIELSGANSTLNISGGSLNSAAGQVFDLGGKTGSSATLTINGTGSVTTAWLRVGQVGASTGVINLGDGNVGGNLTINNSLDIKNGAALTMNLNGGTLTTSTAWGLGGTLVVKSGGAVFNVASNTLTISSNLTTDGTGGGLTKNGTGTLTLSGAGNNYTGTTTVNAGTLTLGANQNLGVITGAGALNLSTFTLTTNASSNSTYSGVISGTGALTKNGSGTLTLTGANGYTGVTTINAGTLQIGTGTTGSIDNTSSIVNNGDLIFNKNSNFTIKGITGTGNLTVNATSNGFITLGGNITQSGTVSISTLTTLAGSAGLRQTNNTTITASSISITGQLGSDGAGSDSKVLTLDTSSTNGSILLDFYNGSASRTWAGAASIVANAGTGNVTIGAQAGRFVESGAWQPASLTGGINITAAFAQGALSVNTLTLNATAASTISSNLSFTANTVNNWTVSPGVTMFVSGLLAGNNASITKAGTGTLTLSNVANAYNGTTTINAGTLNVTGSTASSATTVNSGGTLTGTGTVGAITLNTGGLVGAGTGTATVGKLTGSSLSIGSSSGYAFTIGNVNASVAGTDYDQISLSGALTFSNTAANPFTVYLYGTPTGWSNTGIYSWDLITGATSMDDFVAASFATNFTNFGIAEGSRNGTWSFSSPTDGTIRLTYAGSALTSTWNTTTGSWNTAAQWSENAIPVNNNSLLFTGSGGTATNNISNSTLTSVNNISFESGAGAYTLAASAGSAGASGGTALAVIGSITNNSTNLQTLNTAISLASSSIINAASGNITIGAVISGNGGITKSGANSLTLSTANTYSGGTALNAGTLNIGNATAIGTGTLTITSGTLDNTSGAAMTLTNNNAQNWNGNFTVAGTNDLNMGTGNVTLGATPTVTVSAGNLTVGGIISGSSRGLTKAGSGTMILNGANTYTGTTTINAGTLQIGNGTVGSLSTSSAVVNNANLIYGTTVSTGTYGLSTSTTGTGNLTATAKRLQLNGNITQSGNVSLTGSTATGLYASGIELVSDTTITAGNITITGDLGRGGGANGGNLNLNTSATNGAINLDASISRSGVWYGFSTFTANAGTGNLTVSGSNAANGNWGVTSGVTLAGALNISSNFSVVNSALNLTAAGNSSVTGNLGLNGTTNTWTVNPGLTMTASGNLSGTSAAITKNGTGTLILSGAANTYSGATIVNAGTLQLSGNISSSALTLNSGGIISVGTNTTIAKYNASTITIGAGSGYIFTIGANASGTTAGTDFDQLTATGALTFNNTAASRFTVYVNGSPTNWSNSGNYTWNIMSGASISGFNSGNFAVNTSSFGIASGNRTGTWSFATSGGNLTLSYTLATPDYFWDGGTGNWTDTYSAGVRGFTPANPTVDDNLYFSGSGGTVTNNMANSTISSVNFITFNSTAGAYTLAANATVPAAGTNSTIPLTVKGDITNNSNNTQTISMSLAFDASSSGVINTAAGNITISGSISGSTEITKNGNGSLTLSGTKTNTGNFTINAGNVTISGASLNTNITVNSGATLIAGTNYMIAEGAGNILTINGGTFKAGNAATYINGGIVLNNATITNTGGAGTYISTRGLWTANGNNTINMNISTETLYANGGIFNIQSGTTTINNSIFNYAGWYQGITKNGTGTLVLNGANSYNGTTTLRDGTLVLNNNTALGAGSLSALTIISGTLDVTSGTTITLTNNYTQSWNGDFAFLGTNGSLNVGTGAVTMNASRTVTVSNSTFTVGGAIGGATFGLTKNGSGTLVLSGANTYNGTTTVNNGTITLGAADRIADTSNLNVAGGTFNLGGFNETLGSITGSGNITLGAGTLTTDSSSNTTFSGIISGTGGLTKNGTSTLTLTGNNTYNGTTTINTGTLLISSAGLLGGGNYSGNISNTGTLRYNSTANQTLGGIISGNGALVKNAASTLTLSGNNTFNGTTTITGGTLQISSTGLLGGGNYSANISNTGTLLIASNSNQTLGGVISGSGALTKNGSGTLTLTGNNSYSGATAINSGTLVVNGSAGNSAVTIGNATALTGTGTVGGVTVQSGGRLSPGNNAVGNLNASTLTFNGGGGYNWEISNVSGTPGTNWDLITVGGGTGAVTINANAGNKFTIYLSGNPTGWNTNAAYDWNIIDWGTVTGFDANAFTVDTTGFTGTAPVGTWTFSNTGGYLNLAYAAGDPAWSGTTGNWSTAFSPSLNAGNKTLTFAGAAGGTATNDIPSATVGSVAGITFNSTAGAYTLAANSGSAGYDTASALQLNGNIVNNSTATQTINKALTSTATRVYDAAAGNLTMGGAISGTGGLTKNGSNLLTLSANNTYTGDTTINAGTIQITTTGLLGGGNYSANITNNGALVFGSNSNQTLSGIISGTGALTKNGTGTLTLAGNNNYSGNTTINTGTVVIGHANAAGTGRIIQANGSSLLKIDTTGTISNDMSVYNVLASQSATLSGAITVNNAEWDVNTGTTTTISGDIDGSGGVTKNGNGTLILSGNNTYTAPTVVNAGTLNAASANALGSNNTVQVNGGTLLVSADDAINGMNITLNGTSTTVATLSFTGNYSGAVGNLTLSANSIIDLGTGSTRLSLHDIEMGIYYLKFHNWTGNTLWDGGTGNDTDRVYIISGVTNNELGKMQFYSGTTNDSFLGTGFDLGLTATSFDPGLSGYQIIPVPEPETWATGILLVLGGSIWLWRKRRNITTEQA